MYGPTQQLLENRVTDTTSSLYCVSTAWLRPLRIICTACMAVGVLYTLGLHTARLKPSDPELRSESVKKLMMPPRLPAASFRISGTFAITRQGQMGAKYDD